MFDSCGLWFKYEGFNITTGCVSLGDESYLRFNTTTWQSWICESPDCDSATCRPAPINGTHDFASFIDCRLANVTSSGQLVGSVKSFILPFSAFGRQEQAQVQHYSPNGVNCSGSLERVVGWTKRRCIPSPVDTTTFPYGWISCHDPELIIHGSNGPSCHNEVGTVNVSTSCHVHSRAAACRPNRFVPIDWSTLTPETIRDIDPRTFEVLNSTSVITIPLSVIPHIDPAQVDRLSADALSGFSPQQAALFDYEHGENSTCAVLKIPLLTTGLPGIVPSCIALAGPGVLELFDEDSIQKLSDESFAAISNYSYLIISVFGSARVRQLASIHWVAPVSSEHLMQALKKHRERILEAWSNRQLDFWSGDTRTTNNVIRLKRQLFNGIFIAHINRTSDPSAWTFLHIALLSVESDVPRLFWEFVLPKVPPQALRGLQPSLSPDLEFYRRLNASQAQYLLPDSNVKWDLLQPDAIQGLSSSVYSAFYTLDIFSPEQVASLDPDKVGVVRCSVIAQWYVTLNESVVSASNASQTFWSRVRPELVLALQESGIRCKLNMTIPSDASSGSLIIPPPFVDNRYSWNASTPTPTPIYSPSLVHVNTTIPTESPSTSEESRELIVWRDLAIIFMSVSTPLLVVLTVVCVRNRRLALRLRQSQAASQEEDDRRPLLLTKGSSSSIIGSKTTIWDRAVLLERIGAGGSGAQIFRCSVQGLTCAAKVLDCAHAFDRQISEFKQEVDVLIEASQRSDWVVKYLHHSYNPLARKFIIFMEFFPGTLQTRIGQMKQLKNDEEQIRFSAATIGRIGHGILNGLKSLHNYSREDAATTGTNPARREGAHKGSLKRSKPIIHRDLKPANVFSAFDEVGDVVLIKLGDFGISKLLSVTNQAKTAMCGTPGYMAPEVITAGGSDSYSTAADMYSFGMILYELLTLNSPYYDVEYEAQRNKLVLSGQLPPLPVDIEQNEDYADLVQIWKECANVDPRRRPTASQLLERPAFKSWISS